MQGISIPTSCIGHEKLQSSFGSLKGSYGIGELYLHYTFDTIFGSHGALLWNPGFLVQWST